MTFRIITALLPILVSVATFSVMSGADAGETLVAFGHVAATSRPSPRAVARPRPRTPARTALAHRTSVQPSRLATWPAPIMPGTARAARVPRKPSALPEPSRRNTATPTAANTSRIKGQAAVRSKLTKPKRSQKSRPEAKPQTGKASGAFNAWDKADHRQDSATEAAGTGQRGNIGGSP